MEIAKLRKAGEILGRKGLSERALEIAKKIVKEDSYKGAIIGAGKMAVLCRACTFDDYWSEQTRKGMNAEDSKMESLIK